jgi:hypothetical protein
MPQTEQNNKASIATVKRYAEHLKPLIEPVKNDTPSLSAFYTGYLEIIERLEHLAAIFPEKTA